MTEAERAGRTIAYCREHAAEWDIYLARPLAERAADADKVDAAFREHGVLAARNMMRALGYPMVPNELCDPVEELEAKRAAGTQDQRMRETAAQLGFSEAEVDAIMTAEPIGRMDH